MEKETDKLLSSEAELMKQLHEIVEKSIEEQKSVMENLIHPPREVLTRGQRVSDKVARFGGSWSFIISFFIILVGWILFNSLAPNKDDFDPYPFILMNLVLSCIAALQAPIIMMSQNRKDEKDRMRNQNDYLVNLKTEIELRELQKKMDLLLQDQLKSFYESQARQLEILNRIEKMVSQRKI